MLRSRKLEGSNTIEFILFGNSICDELDSFIAALKCYGEVEDFLLIGTLANFDNRNKLRDTIELLDSEFRLIEGLSQFTIITDKKNIKQIQLLTNKRLPYLPIKIFEIEENDLDLGWIKNEACYNISDKDH